MPLEQGTTKSREQREPKATKLFHTTHIATQTHIESYPHHSTPVIVEAEVGGATMHMVNVEHFEQF